MNTIKITKMNGCGNDFVIVEKPEFDKTNMSMSEFAKKVCNRNFGVGGDGLIIPKLDNNIGADIGWYFYNSDGSTAQMCGNGMRCFAKYVHDNKIIDKRIFSVMTGAGIITPEILEDGNISVNMGSPIMESDRIPFKGKNVLNFEITSNNRTFGANAISMGNPHCIIFVSKDDDVYEMAKTYGPEIESHALFPEKTNVEFISIKSRDEIDFCVYERGCGITLACGTGACASIVAGVLNNLTERKVKVNLLGGAVIVDWSTSKGNINSDIYLIGEANYNFYGDYIL